MDECRLELTRLQEGKDKEIEEFIEKNTEEKIISNTEVKNKYQRLINMLKNSKDPKKDERIEQYEDKKAVETKEL